ncbi:hypothetical protein ABVK25_012154 [Lepraria finkii]|uniref:Uncharacterized protein n=1 Tax=Lepraria finkii TaxID=1340010 RepID=A0ABR4AHY5_9LECA
MNPLKVLAADSCAHLPAALRIHMKQIRVQRHCRDRYAHYLPIYEDGDDRIVPCVLDGEAVDEDEDRDGHDGRGEVDWKEARFGNLFD